MGSLKIVIALGFLSLLSGQTILTEENDLQYDYLIKVKFSEFRLILINTDGKEMVSFPVALPKKMPKLPIEGWVVRIEKDPWWYPTEETRVAYLTDKGITLPKAIPPRHSRNAMGKVKIWINFITPGVHPAIRIHGTNDPSSIGRKITRDCIRLHNRDALTLVKIIQGKLTKVIFEL
jgi:L,D-transpeptidase ErfK/SrfK